MPQLPAPQHPADDGQHDIVDRAVIAFGDLGAAPALYRRLGERAGGSARAVQRTRRRRIHNLLNQRAGAPHRAPGQRTDLGDQAVAGEDRADQVTRPRHRLGIAPAQQTHLRAINVVPNHRDFTEPRPAFIGQIQNFNIKPKAEK
jgi:hypothetical protein